MLALSDMIENTFFAFGFDATGNSGSISFTQLRNYLSNMGQDITPFGPVSLDDLAEASGYDY